MPRRTAVLPSGYPQLDRLLHQGGWPDDGLVELLTDAPCPQLLRLLFPAMKACGEGMILLANPPARPFATSLQQVGIDLQRVHLLYGRSRGALLSACRDALASEAVRFVVLWYTASAPVNDLRRLHLAARQGRCLLWLISPAKTPLPSSPAPLRLRVSPRRAGHVHLQILKQPGGRPGQHCTLTLLPEHLVIPFTRCRDMPSQTRAPQAPSNNAPKPATTPLPGQSHPLPRHLS